VSHVADEAGSFLPPNIDGQKSFDRFLKHLFPLADVRERIANKYPYNEYENQTLRAGYIIRDAVFICNTRVLYDAYSDKVPTFMMQYNFLEIFHAAVHTADLLPTFWNNRWKLSHFLQVQLCLGSTPAKLFAAAISGLAKGFQTYFARFAVSGFAMSELPGPAADNRLPVWKPAVSEKVGEKKLRKVLEVDFAGQEFHPDSIDSVNTGATCDFWRDIARRLSESQSGRSAEEDHFELKKR